MTIFQRSYTRQDTQVTTLITGAGTLVLGQSSLCWIALSCRSNQSVKPYRS